MAFFTKNLGLKIWNSESDRYNHQELARNWIKVEEHDHTSGRGKQIPSAGIADGAITKAKLANGIISDIASQINIDTVTAIGTSKISNAAVTDAKLSPFAKVPLGTIFPWWDWTGSTDLSTIQNNLNAALGLSNSDINLGRFPWRICNGSTIGLNQHDFGTGTFTLPNLNGRFLMGAGSTIVNHTTGGVTSHNLEHTHNVDHIHTVAGHTHSVTNVKMPDHKHADPNGNYIVKGGSGDNKYLYIPHNKPIPSSWPDYVGTTNFDSKTTTDNVSGGVSNKSLTGYAGASANTGKSGDSVFLTSKPKPASDTAESNNNQLNSLGATPQGNVSFTDIDNKPPYVAVIYIIKVLKTV